MRVLVVRAESFWRWMILEATVPRGTVEVVRLLLVSMRGESVVRVLLIVESPGEGAMLWLIVKQ
jgi:hypothetical protein